MAHFASLLMMPIEAVVKQHTRDSILECALQTFGCSHFIAAHPRIKPILDEGTPIDTDLWHPIASPHYHLPTDLSSAVETLESLEADEPELRNDQNVWILQEIYKLRDACRYAIAHDLALVVFLSNTLSKHPQKKIPTQPQQTDRERPLD